MGHLDKEDPKVRSIIISEKQKSGWEHSIKHVEVIQDEVKAKVNEEKVDKSISLLLLHLSDGLDINSFEHLEERLKVFQQNVAFPKLL